MTEHVKRKFEFSKKDGDAFNGIFVLENYSGEKPKFSSAIIVDKSGFEWSIGEDLFNDIFSMCMKVETMTNLLKHKEAKNE